MAAVVLPTYLVSQIVDMFASALGQEKSHEIVRQHLQQHGITSDVLTFEQVSHMLDVLSRKVAQETFDKQIRLAAGIVVR